MEGNFRRGTEPNRADRLDGPVLDGSSNKRKMQYNSKRRPVLVVHLDSVLDFLGIYDATQGAASASPSRVQKASPIQRGVGTCPAFAARSPDAAAGRGPDSVLTKERKSSTRSLKQSLVLHRR